MQHNEKIKQLATQVLQFHKQKTAFRIYHGSTNSTRPMAFERSKMLDTSRLNELISIDQTTQTVVVEPNVPMDALLKATLKVGLLPKVITEFPGITVGGGIQGGAGESSSFKYGFLNQTANWVEYIIGDGSIVRASPDVNADLFYGAAGSMGTLGVITAAELSLIPAKRNVRLTYHHAASFEEAIRNLRGRILEDYDYIDGIMFSSHHGVIITGQLTDDDTATSKQRFSRAGDPWFYLHASQAADGQVETVPLTDYLFRYDRGAFWVGRFAFERFKVPFNRLTRWLIDPLLHTRKLYQALQDSGASQEYIVQDVSLPHNQAADFMRRLDRNQKIYPLWLCPILPAPQSPLLCNGLPTDLVINIGIWGPRIADFDEYTSANRQIENQLHVSGGKKWLYARTFYTAAEFWQNYDRLAYNKLRQQYRVEYLPDIYDKIRPDPRLQVNARRGLLRTLFGRAKLPIS